MTDNGSAYRSHLIADLCRSRRMRHIFTSPYTARTNGKAERFIENALREWAYARPYDHSQQRAEALLHWLHSYNHHRPHQGIGLRFLRLEIQPVFKIHLDAGLPRGLLRLRVDTPALRDSLLYRG